jgi:hypothetical protein
MLRLRMEDEGGATRRLADNAGDPVTSSEARQLRWSESPSVTHPRLRREDIRFLGPEAEVLVALDSRIASCDVDEAERLVKVRGQIQKQNQDALDRDAIRAAKRRDQFLKPLGSAVALASGVAVLCLDFPMVGFFIIGASLCWLAPQFVTSYFAKTRMDHHDD